MNLIYQAVVRYAVARLKEASTYRNLIILVGGAWAAQHHDQVELLVPVCLALAGFVGSFFPDQFGGTPRVLPTATAAALPPIELVARPEPDSLSDARLLRDVVPPDPGGSPQPDAGWGG